MSKVHVLKANSFGDYQVVIHSPTPVDKNTAGVSWKDAARNAGLTGTSILPTGTGPGQISTVELATITSGDTLEIVGTVATVEDPVLLEQKVDEIIVTMLTSLKQELKNYGRTQ